MFCAALPVTPLLQYVTFAFSGSRFFKNLHLLCDRPVSNNYPIDINHISHYKTIQYTANY